LLAHFEVFGLAKDMEDQQSPGTPSKLLGRPKTCLQSNLKISNSPEEE
jgi:hypothetical protein